MRQRISNKLVISVDGIDLQSLTKIEFYVRQLSTFFQYVPTIVDSSTMVVVIPKADADKLSLGSVKLQFAYTDAEGNDDASDPICVDVGELLKAEGYDGD